MSEAALKTFSRALDVKGCLTTKAVEVEIRTIPMMYNSKIRFILLYISLSPLFFSPLMSSFSSSPTHAREVSALSVPLGTN